MANRRTGIVVAIVTVAVVAIGALYSFIRPRADAETAPANTQTATVAPTSAATAAPTVAAEPTATAPAAGSVTVTASVTRTGALTSPLPTPTATAPPSPLQYPEPSALPVYSYTIVNAYPHDPNAYTQGLVYTDGVLYEGTGLTGRSTLRKVDLETGEVQQMVSLPPDYFGEGIAVWGDQVRQLTWESHVGFVYDREDFTLLEGFGYPTEGWGLTHDGERLIMSDGTATLTFRDPQTFEEVGRVEVRDPNGPVMRLNELEYVDGEIYANVWQTNYIARIAPETGQVVGWIDLTGLLRAEDVTQPVNVLNGIAYDAENDRLFVTGKLWPKLFEIELSPR